MTTTINNPSRAANKNWFINPDFAVVQDPANISGSLTNSISLPTQTLGYPGKTSWWMTSITSSSLPTYSISPQNQSITYTGASGVTAIYQGQRLESKDTNKLKNKTVTISFKTSNSLLTSMTWEVYRPTTSDDIHGTITTPTQTLIASGTINISSTLTRHQVSFALPDEASKGLEFRFYVGSQTSGTWVMSQMQLEEGPVATDFNCGDYPSELLRCLRHFWALTDSISAQGNATGAGAKSFNSFANPTPMFATPATSITTSGLVNLSAIVLNVSPISNTLEITAAAAGGFTGTISACSFSSHIP